MPKTNALEALAAVLPDVIATMPAEFDSHDFFRALGRQHQRLYVRALAAYANTDRPFQIVHSAIAHRLLGQRSLVRKIGEKLSRDCFGQENSAAIWRRSGD